VKFKLQAALGHDTPNYLLLNACPHVSTNSTLILNSSFLSFVLLIATSPWADGGGDAQHNGSA
jgi:hypothetical protein